MIRSLEIIANSLKDKGIPVSLQIITAPLMFRFRYHSITHSHLYCFFNKFLPGIKNTPAHCVYNKIAEDYRKEEIIMVRCYYLDYESNGNLKLLPHYEREDSEQIHSDYF